MKVLVKKPGESAAAKVLPQGDVVKAMKKIIKPGIFFGLLRADLQRIDIAALAPFEASPAEKIVVYCKKRQNLKVDGYNFPLSKTPLITVYGNAVFIKIKNSSAETVEAVNLTDDEIKAIEKLIK